MLKDRDLNAGELVDYIVPQLTSAAQLGFTIARLQYFSYSVIERLLPWAEKLNLKLGYELHVPLMIKSARTQGLIEQIERINSPFLGLIPDTGIFAHSIPEFRLNATRAAGVSEELVERAITLWNAKTPDHVALEELLKLGLRRENIANIEMIWGSFGQSEPEELKTILPYVIHMHGKFFSMRNGEEPNVRFEEVVKVLVENGYDGWISSEYEGQGGLDTFGLVREQQAMIRRYAEVCAEIAGACNQPQWISRSSLNMQRHAPVLRRAEGRGLAHRGFESACAGDKEVLPGQAALVNHSQSIL